LPWRRRRALALVAARALRDADGSLTWLATESVRSATPYWRWGSAGIGMVLLRYLRALGEARHEALLAGLDGDTDRKYTIFPGRFFGLAGIGDFHLDRALLGHDRDRERALLAARKALSGILLFRVERAAGTAFPGESRTRISCDFGTGGAGIALFLHRLLTGGGPAFMLDELLGPSSSTASGRAAEVGA
jgi:hypothetical protein